MNKVVTKGALSTLLAAILLLWMTTTASAASQLWYLDSVPHAEGTGARVMEKTIGAQSGSVTIGPGDQQIWLAENNTGSDATFPEGCWVTEIRTDSDWGTEGDKCEVSVGGWDAYNGWYEFPTITVARVTWDIGGFGILELELQTASATIYAGDYLALRIKNEDSGSHEVYTDGRSSVRSPDSDPGYPVPEPGDANMDGKVDSRDLVKVKRIILGLDPSTPGADANLDGKIDSRDLVEVKRIILGLD